MSVVYFAQALNGGAIKIGCSGKPNMRARQLAQLFPYGVEIIATIPGGRFTEGFLHRCFRPIAVSQEWFRSCTAIWKLLIDIEAHGRPAFIPDEKYFAGRDLPNAVIEAFGSKEAAKEACGYSQGTAFSDAFGNASRGGGWSRLAFTLALRDDALPRYITDLHRRPNNVELSADAFIGRAA